VKTRCFECHPIDHACIQCDPYSSCLQAGYLCSYHTYVSSGSDMEPKGTTLTPAKKELLNLGYVKLNRVSVATPFLRDEIGSVILSALDELRSKGFFHHSDVAIVSVILQDIAEYLEP
jgi:hypothetical protein